MKHVASKTLFYLRNEFTSRKAMTALWCFLFKTCSVTYNSRSCMVLPLKYELSFWSTCIYIRWFQHRERENLISDQGARMGRRPCCAKVGINRGAWSAREDKILMDYIKVHGEGKWRDLPERAGAYDLLTLSVHMSFSFSWSPFVSLGYYCINTYSLYVRLS